MIADLLFAFYGEYKATGAYSFEFRRHKPSGSSTADSIAEIFLLLPPGSVRWSEPALGEATKTIGGAFLTDFGAGFKRGTVEGECHFFYVGKARTGATGGGSPDDGFLDGFTEFMKLRFMLSRYRDYTMTHDAKLFSPDFSGVPLASVNSLKKFVKNLVDDGDGALEDQIDVIWHDYDRDDHFFVRISDFASTQAKNDPWTIQWNVELEAYAVDRGGGAKMMLFNAVKKKSVDEIRDAYLLSMKEHPDSIPDELPVSTPSGALSVGVLA